jgi:hypothetical protein
MSNQYTVPAPAAAQEAPAPAPSHGRDHHTAGAGPAGPPPHPPIIGGPWLGVAAAPGGGGPVPPPLHRNQFQQHMHPMGLPPVPPIGGGTQSHHHRHHHQLGRPSQQFAKSNKRSINNTSNTASASSSASASLPTFLVQTQGSKRKRDPALPKQRRKRYSREEKGRIMLVLYSNPTGLDGPPVRLSDVAQQFGLPEGYVFLL